MNGPFRFALVPIATLRDHEEVDPEGVDRLVTELREEGRVLDPLWVSEGSFVILNGHHRFQALRRLGAERAPAWVIDYEDPRVHLERWQPDPPIAKAEVVARAIERRPFPPTTTRHSLEFPLPHRPTPLASLGGPLLADRPDPAADR